MNRAQLTEFLRKLDLPDGQWVAFGGSCLAANDIRDAGDVDIFVTPKLYKQLQRSGWSQHRSISTGSVYLRKVIKEAEVQAFITCGTDKWRPDVKRYIDNPCIIEGMPFIPLIDMYEWKAATRRPKDVQDLALIEPLLNKSVL